MAKKKQEKHLNAKQNAYEQKQKQKAYEQKQEKQGRSVVGWIFGLLIALAIFYVIFTITLVS